jgi:predicted nucleic acid-binding protein
MVTAFVDTSALYALLARQTDEHAAVREAFLELTASGRLVTHSYVVVETIALFQRRFGIEPVASLEADILPLVDVHWVGPELHAQAVEDLVTSRARSVSFVDRVSFAFMRSRFIDTAFTIDRDFAGEGFTVVPA